MAKTKAITALFETMTNVQDALNDMTGLTASSLANSHPSVITQEVNFEKTCIATADWARSATLESNRADELLLSKEPVEGMRIGSQVAAVPLEIIKQLGHLSAVDTEELGSTIIAGPLFFSLVNGAENPTLTSLTEVIKRQGFSEEDAKLYIEGIRRGYTMVTIFVSGSYADQDAQEARDLLERHHPIDVNELIEERPRAVKKSIPDEAAGIAAHRSIAEEGQAAEAYGGADEVGRKEAGRAKQVERETNRRKAGAERATKEREALAFEDYDNAFHSHFERTYSSSGVVYETYLPAYRYGYNLAISSRYHDRDWENIEPEVRERWESHNPDTWDDFQDAIYEGWYQVHAEEEMIK